MIDKWNGEMPKVVGKDNVLLNIEQYYVKTHMYAKNRKIKISILFIDNKIIICYNRLY